MYGKGKRKLYSGLRGEGGGSGHQESKLLFMVLVLCILEAEKNICAIETAIMINLEETMTSRKNF